VLGSTGISRQVGQIDFGLHDRGKLNFRLLGCLAQSLERLAILPQINSILLFEFLNQVIHDAQIKVITTQEGISGSGLHLEDALAHIQDGNIKCTTAKIIDGNNFILLFIQSIRQGRSRWFVNDTQNFKPGNFPGILGGIALGVVKVSRNGNHRLGDWFTQICLRVSFQFGKNHGGNFRRGIFLAIQNNAHVSVGCLGYFIRHTPDGALNFRIVIFTPHETLDGKDGVFRVDNGLVAGRSPHQPLMVLIDCHNRRDQAFPFRGRDYRGFSTHHDRHNRIGCT